MGKSISVMGVILTIVGMAWAQRPDAAPNASKAASKDKLISSIQGPALYKAYCETCHGIDGKGKGPGAAALKVPPADLTRIAARNRGTFPLMHIEKIISGEEVRKGHGAMPAWGPTFWVVGQDQDLGRVRIDNLARYLRDIQAK